MPLHVPVLGHCQAYAFPYAAIPWLTVRPLLGDWVVTLRETVGHAGEDALQQPGCR